MSCAQCSSRRIPGEGPEKFCNPSVRDNWVYLSSEGAEITTLEAHSCSLAPSNYQQESEPRSQSTGRLGGDVNFGESQTNVSTLKSHRGSEHAIALLSELRRTRISYKRSRGKYQMCCEQLKSCLSRPATASSHETYALESNFQLGTDELQRHLDSLSVRSEALDKLESQLNDLDAALGIGKESMRENDLNADGAREVAYCEIDSELERQTELSDTSSNAPSAVEDYFDKAREVFVIKERLAELDQEQSDRTSQSQSELEQNDSSRCDDRESDDDYHSQRQQLLEALVLAESELHDLREACLRDGIEPELNRYRRISERQDQSGEMMSECLHTLSAPIRLVRDALASIATSGNEM